MTEDKRFKVYKVIGRFHEWSVEDTVDDKVVFDSIMCKYSADKVCNKLNELNDEKEELEKENKELRQDNDIKFWKLQCLQSSNNNQIMLFELSRAIRQGYGVSDKFKQYLDEIKEHDKEIRKKHKRLFE